MVSVTVTCEGECYLDEFETEDLVKELKRRKREIETKTERNTFLEIYDALCAGDHEEAKTIIESVLWPKWKTVEDCEAAVQALKQHATN